jgi:NTP pyrophosphatase (non-canonical NTP hydrolase)
MTPSEYLELSERTDSPDYVNPLMQFRKEDSFENIRILHAAIGISTEAGEILDVMKKKIFYGKPIDRVNLLEEFGDVCWYIAVALRELESSFEEIMEANIKKLEKRFPEKFTNEKALERDLKTERQTLEENL